MIGKFVIVRTYYGGIHCGVLLTLATGQTTLTNARRIWRWGAANTLNELALVGASQDYTRISQPVASIMLLEACEIVECSATATENLSASRWGA